MTRARLFNRRAAVRYEVVHDGMRFIVTLGAYRDGRPGEVFVEVDGRNASSGVGFLAREAAILASVAVQYGAPWATLRAAVLRDGEGRPLTLIGAVLDSIGRE